MTLGISFLGTFLLVTLIAFNGDVVEGFVVTSNKNWSPSSHQRRHHHHQGRDSRPVPPFSFVLKASSSSASTTTAKTKKKASSHSKNNNKAAKAGRHRSSRRGKGENIQAISEQELVEHVSSMYMRPDRTPNDDDDDDDVDTTSTTTTTTPNNSNTIDASKRLSRFPALVLNADYQPMSYLPLSLWNWQDAIKAVFSGKVTVVDVYPDTFVRAASLEIPLPSVIALNDYVAHHSEHQTPAFTRRNVFLRDGYKCQYCYQAFHPRDLSLDHVVPRSAGGRLHWTNAVTSCRQCNGRKGSLLPTQLALVGMQWRGPPPRPPSQRQLAQRAGTLLPRRRVHPTWKPFLEAVLRRNGNKDEVEASSDNNNASSHPDSVGDGVNHHQ